MTMKEGDRVYWQDDPSDTGTVVDVGYMNFRVEWDCGQTSLFSRFSSRVKDVHPLKTITFRISGAAMRANDWADQEPDTGYADVDAAIRTARPKRAGFGETYEFRCPAETARVLERMTRDLAVAWQSDDPSDSAALMRAADRIQKAIKKSEKSS